MKLFKPFFDFMIHLLTHLDQHAFSPMRPHAGKIIGFEVREFGQILYFNILEDKLDYLPELPPNESITTLISGNLQDFVSLWVNSKKQTSLSANIHIHGDMALAESFHRIFSEMDIDWEDRLANVLGDTLAFQISEMAKSSHQWGRDFLSHRAEDLTEFLQHEQKALPTGIEVNDFCEAVDKLRDDAERLVARVERLEKQTSS